MSLTLVYRPTDFHNSPAAIVTANCSNGVVADCAAWSMIVCFLVELFVSSTLERLRTAMAAFGCRLFKTKSLGMIMDKWSAHTVGDSHESEVLDFGKFILHFKCWFKGLNFALWTGNDLLGLRQTIAKQFQLEINKERNRFRGNERSAATLPTAWKFGNFQSV